jgi:uncharacterized protein
MTSFRIETLDFSKDAVEIWKLLDESHVNWPVVYVLDDRGTKTWPIDIYVGETRNAGSRLQQHLKTPDKQGLTKVRVIFHERFNKSVCLDLESYLIKMLSGDSGNQVLNRNNGIIEANYYQRDIYREAFRSIFDRLKADGVFTKSAPEIENSVLFKLSPFKALTEDQASSVEEIVASLLTDFERGEESTIVIQGDPGTGKSVVAVYLLKLLADIQTFKSLEDLDSDSRFSHFFTETNQHLLRGLRMGLVVPQSSLRESMKRVFRQTKGLDEGMVMDAFQLGQADDTFDLLLVDETHRLNQRANQASGPQNTQFKVITTKLFGRDDLSKTQLDWIQAKSRHRIFLLDTAQGVRPADLPTPLLSRLIADTRDSGRHFQLKTQMRVQAGSDYVSYIRYMLDPQPTSVPRSTLNLGSYDLKMFDSIEQMRLEIRLRDAEVGLSRMVAGFAWEWKTKKTKSTAFDIEIDGTQLRWNSAKTDWISSPKALEEVGSIHKVQGYDLNYVGVIIGLDLRYDPGQKRLYMDRASYRDKKGMENNDKLGIKYSEDDILRFITQIYAVLMTRGIRGTYVYVCDAGLKEYLKRFIPSSSRNPINSALNPSSFEMVLD